MNNSPEEKIKVRSKSKKKILLIGGIVFCVVGVTITAIILLSSRSEESKTPYIPENTPDYDWSLKDMKHDDDTESYSGYGVNDLTDAVDEYSISSDSEKKNVKYNNLGYALKKKAHEYVEKYGWDDVGTILLVSSLAEYYCENKDFDSARNLLDTGITSTDNQTAIFHYFYQFRSCYRKNMDKDNIIKYDELILSLDDNEVEPLMADSISNIKEVLTSEINSLKEEK